MTIQFFNGSYQLEIEIITQEGKKQSIREFYSKVILEESIYQNTFIGSVTMADPVGFVTVLPLIGQEKLRFVLRTDTNSEEISKTFSIYKVDEIAADRD